MLKKGNLRHLSEETRKFKVCFFQALYDLSRLALEVHLAEVFLSAEASLWQLLAASHCTCSKVRSERACLLAFGQPFRLLLLPTLRSRVRSQARRSTLFISGYI